MKLPSAPRAVITGAGSGLGRALALELARRGARVLVADIDAASSAETAALVANAGGEAEVLPTDVTRAADLERAAETAERLWGGTDLLVNNAGVAVVGAVGEVPLADWDFVMRVNLWGVIHGCHAFVPGMKTRRAGFVLNVASSAGLVTLPEMGPYNVTKSAVIALSETLHAELAPEGIGVSALCPTFFPTNLMQRFRAPDERHRRMAEAMFRRSSASAADVARAALRGLESGRAVIVPQLDGKLLWYLKRWAPRLYQAALGFEQRRGLFARQVLGVDRADAPPRGGSK